MKTGILALASVLIVMTGIAFMVPVASLDAMGCQEVFCLITGASKAPGTEKADCRDKTCGAATYSCSYESPGCCSETYCGNYWTVIGYPCDCTTSGNQEWCDSERDPFD